MSPCVAADVAMVVLFAIDTAINFRVAYYSGERLVEDGRAVARHYLGTAFAVDLAGCLPLDWMALAAVGGLDGGADPGTLALIPLIKLVHLVRAPGGCGCRIYSRWLRGGAVSRM